MEEENCILIFIQTYLNIQNRYANNNHGKQATTKVC